MIYTDEVYSEFVDQVVDMDLWQQLLEDAEANAPEVTTQDFKINTWNYNATNVPRLTAEDMGHEWAYSHPLWFQLEQSYRQAAKGFSSELVGKEVTRLCSYLVVRARPSGESVSIFNINVRNLFRNAYENQLGLQREINYPYSLTLTGQFVDMPDGRWHYVYLGDHVRVATRQFYWRYLRPEYTEDEYRNEYYAAHAKYPEDGKYEEFLSQKASFRFGFVREDLLGKLKSEYEKFYTAEFIEFVNSLPISHQYSGGFSSNLYAEFPSHLPPVFVYDVTDIPVGVNEPYNLILNEIDKDGLPELFSTYPYERGSSGPIYFKPKGVKAWIGVSAERDAKDLADELNYLTSSGTRKYDLLDFRDRLDSFRELYPGYRNPGYYAYAYEYYENPENGNSYIYYLLPAYDLRKLLPDTPKAYFLDPELQRVRVNVVPNDGTTGMLDELADEIEEELTPPDSSEADRTAKSDIIQRNLLADVGIIALGSLILKRNI